MNFYDFALTFAEEYVKAGYLQKGRKVLIIRTAVGATCFYKKDWGVGGRLYVKLMEILDYALKLNKNNKIVAFLWHQGESDALDHNTPEQYIKDCKEKRLEWEDISKKRGMWVLMKSFLNEIEAMVILPD